MAIKIFWTDFAKDQLKNIFDYYKLKASHRIAKNLVIGIVEKTHTLNFQKEIGQKEELLFSRNENFRYLIYKNYKIIYWFNEAKERIEISDVFDTRQNPIKIHERQ
ncbi:type II toxin-antitoxin system RelE/ParE family toxin [Chryseobacterium fluminis]|uniref:type II toxin-antitoxin system RelE/ParE family toxin n=1 Tax=Chryseobacterium fluminis TaxID=2983606 RepID=UPI00225180DC|nr:type II toxin-antitoxin system RelE/ParE family toxin [Chryseobacterium sp. MMS21-Ot14]UZT97693.1 type II toxin-antitoxin system RelE/ParE family toxin [Chryseobacterium sp. MMS21-Ot14]